MYSKTFKELKIGDRFKTATGEWIVFDKGTKTLLAYHEDDEGDEVTIFYDYEFTTQNKIKKVWIKTTSDQEINQTKEYTVKRVYNLKNVEDIEDLIAIELEDLPGVWFEPDFKYVPES